MSAATLKTIISEDGQVDLPQSLRDRRGWRAGLELTVEDTPAGILLKRDAPKNPFPPTRLEDVCGVAKYDGPAITVEAMNQAVSDEVRARWERFERTGTDYEDDDEGG